MYGQKRVDRVCIADITNLVWIGGAAIVVDIRLQKQYSGISVRMHAEIYKKSKKITAEITIEWLWHGSLE